MIAQPTEVERLRSRLRIASEISEAVSRAFDLDEVLSTALDHLLEHYQISVGLIMVRSRSGRLRVGRHRGLQGEVSHAFEELTEVVSADGQTLVTGSDVLGDGSQCVVSVPIWSNEDLVGVLHLASQTPGRFSEDDSSFLEPLGHVVGVAITNARLHKALTDELRSSRTVNSIARQITEGSLEIHQLLSRAGRTLREHFGLDHCGFLLLDTLRTTLVAVDSDDPSTGLGGLRIQMRSEPALNSILRGTKAVAGDSVPGLARLTASMNIESGYVAVVPLITGGRAVGMAVMGRASAEIGAFSRGDLERLETVAAYIAGAFENSRLYQESLDLNRDLIELDAVTQLSPSADDSEHTVRQLLEKAVAGTGAEAGGVYRASADSPTVLFVSEGAVEGFSLVEGGRMGACARAAASDGRAVELRMPMPQTGSLLAFPLRSLSDEPGAMVVYTKGTLEERDRRLCSVVADRMGSIMDNARLFGETRLHLEELTRRNSDLLTLNRRNQELAEKLSGQLEARRREAQLAADIQKSLLADEIPQGRDLDVAVAYLPLEEASGDYYDVFSIDEDRTGFVITDAVGHGVPAAFVGGFSKMLLDVYKPWLLDGKSPGQVLQAINDRLCSYGHDQLMTMFLGVYDRTDRSFAYANGGHPYPIVFTKAGDLFPLASVSHIMGAWLLGFEDSSAQLQAGDRVLFYTDGLVEAKEASGRRLGKAPVVEWFREHRAESPPDLNRGLYSLVSEFTGGRIDHDDVTLLTLAVLDAEPYSGHVTFGDFEELSAAWLVIRDGLAEFSFDTRTQYAIRLALEEAMTNSVRHGCRGGVPAILEYVIDGTVCQLTVKDNGPGFRPDSVPDPTAPDKLGVAGGRGIFMIRLSVDEVSWNPAGNEITMFKRKARRIDILKTSNSRGAMDMADEIRVTLGAVGATPILVVAGAANAVSASVLSDGMDQLLEKSPKGVLDLSDVDFLGSAAVSILVKGFSAAKAKGIKLVIVSPSDSDVKEMLEILGLMSFFPVTDSRDDAVAQLG